MLDNTKQAWDRLKKDLNIIKYIFLYGFNSLLFLYYFVMVILQKGNVIANAILFGMTIASICVSINLDKKGLKKEEKRNLKRSKHLFSVVKIFTKAYTLGQPFMQCMFRQLR
ncbi:MAG: hypothetical protein IJW64_02685 [Clostridia bacterium]|nr:hypothetical protein [Clostridia bacterium]